ncbi:MAG TPA: ferredoxin [candidate division Zixibacteria bacterium]|nr:ferredoxin [candidate division Zixibacteria bacterium]
MLKIIVTRQLCGQCGLCSGACPALAIVLHGWGLEIDQEKCTGCGRCVTVCPTGALRLADKSEKLNTTTP